MASSVQSRGPRWLWRHSSIIGTSDLLHMCADHQFCVQVGVNPRRGAECLTRFSWKEPFCFQAIHLQARAEAREEEARRAAAKRLLASQRRRTTQTNKGTTRQANNPGGERGVNSSGNQKRRGGGGGGGGPDFNSYTGMRIDAPPAGGKRGGRGRAKGKNVAGAPPAVASPDALQGRHQRGTPRQQPPPISMESSLAAVNAPGTYQASAGTGKRTPQMDW